MKVKLSRKRTLNKFGLSEAKGEADSPVPGVQNSQLNRQNKSLIVIVCVIIKESYYLFVQFKDTIYIPIHDFSHGFRQFTRGESSQNSPDFTNLIQTLGRNSTQAESTASGIQESSSEFTGIDSFTFSGIYEKLNIKLLVSNCI